jgi:predicted ArsR family transcriptional regulator
MKSIPSRIRIHEYLRKYQTASSTELASALGMTSANIRHHLEILESNDIIELVGQRKLPGRGRPMNVYGLSRRVLGDNLDQLISAILSAWVEKLPDDEKEEKIRMAARWLATRGGERQIQDGNLPESLRLSKMVKWMNEYHYQARWEAGAQGPRIILGHCPYRAIIASHPEICGIDAHLLSIHLGRGVRQTTKLEPSQRGAPFCVFLMD